MNTNLKLPACERCRTRKIKCDSRTPKCTNCEKAKSACILVDAVSHERHTRQAIFELEEKLKLLEASKSSDTDEASSDAAHEHPFIGSGSELEFLKYLLSTADWVNAQADLLRYLNVRFPLPTLPVPVYDLPSLDFTHMIVNDYFKYSHILHPFLNPRDIDQVIQRIYHQTAEPTRQDYYRIYMVLALGSITKSRRKTISEYPYGFFKAAQQYVPLAKIGTLEGIQNILLRALFAGFYHVKISTWEMSNFCMRQCIELGLHRRARKPITPFDEQMNRRVFWTCYVQDRFASSMLGRPCAILDKDIDQPLPLILNDEDILASDAQRLDDMTPRGECAPCETGIFVFSIRLRQLCTRLQRAFRAPSRTTRNHMHQISEAGHIYTNARKSISELDELLKETPVFPQPLTVYRNVDWSEFLVVKEKLFLLRGAMSRMSSSGLHPAKDLLQNCLECATKVIKLYIKLQGRQCVNWSRSYFQWIFTAGLSIIFALNTTKRNHRPMDTAEINEGISALPQCGNILQEFVEEMPDAARFALVFDVLWKKCLEQLNIDISDHYTGVIKVLQATELRSRCPLTAIPTSTAPSGPWSESADTQDPHPQSVVGTYSSVEPGLTATQSRPTTQALTDTGEVGFQSQTPQEPVQAESDAFDYAQWPLFDHSLMQEMELSINEMTWGEPLTDANVWRDLFSDGPGAAFM